MYFQKVSVELQGTKDDVLFSMSKSINLNKCSPEMDNYTPPKKRAKPRWAIVALTRKSDILHKRNQLLAAQIRPYAKDHDVTVLIFSELQFGQQFEKDTVGVFAGVAKVQFVDTRKDGFPEGNGKYRYGYKYMCKFFSVDLYKYLTDYDYYWRVDSDDFMEKLTYDLFAWVEREDVHYGWAARKIEGHGATRRTLPPWVAAYANKCQIWPSALMDDPLKKCFNFYNNFHVGKVSFFQRPDVMHFLKEVEASGGIDRHRWGDSTVQAYAVRLFMDSKKIRMLPDLSYVHKSHGMKLISTFNRGKGGTLPMALPYWVDPAHEGKDWL